MTKDNGAAKAGWSDPAYNGKTIHLVSDDTALEYVFRWPNNGHLSRYSQDAMTGKIVRASRNLVLDLALFPSKETLSSRFDELPGLPVALANEINKKTGLAAEFSEKN